MNHTDEVGEGRWYRAEHWYQLAGPDCLVELHQHAGGATVHAYAPGPLGVPAEPAYPLDGYQHVASRQVPDLVDADPDTVWAFLQQLAGNGGGS